MRRFIRRIVSLRLMMAASALAVALAALSGCAQAPAASYPSKPIDIIVPFSPGGGTDVVAQIVADRVSSKWNQPVNVVNKPGGGGTPGTVEAIQAQPDGYTMTMLAASTSILNLAIQTDLPYKWNDVTHVARIAITPLVLVVKADSPYQTAKDLVEAIKQDPSKFKFGSSGVAGPSTFGVAQLLDDAGIDPTKVDVVPFNGGAPALAAVAGGHVDFAAQNLSEVLSLVEGKQLRALAVSGDEKAAELPDVPTATEAGYPGFKQVGVFGMAGPKGLPENVISAWESAVSEAMKDSAFTDKLKQTGNIPSYLGSKEYTSWTEDQVNSATSLAKTLGLQK